MGILAAEAFIVEQLTTLLQGKVRGVQTLPGDWDDEMLKRFLRAVPGVFVAFAGGAAAPAGAQEARLQSRWVAYVVTGHPNELARRQGDAQQLGAYQLLAVVLPFLHGLNVPGVGTLSLVDVANLYTGTIDRQALTVYAVTLGMEMGFDLVPADEALAPFETFVAQYDTPPHSPALHDDWLAEVYTSGSPDARDDVSLPQD